MDLNDHLRVMWRRRWLILGLSLVIAGLVFARSRSQPKVYRSEAKLSLTSGSDQITKDELDFLVGTYTGLARTEPVLREAVSRSGQRMSVESADRRVSVSPASTGGLIRVTATGSTRSAAGALAGGVSNALVAAVDQRETETRERAIHPVAEQVRSLRKRLGAVSRESPELPLIRSEYQSAVARLGDLTAGPTNHLDQVQSAVTERGPISPTPERDATLAFLVALIVNAELMVAAEVVGNRFRTDELEVVQRETGLPVLAMIPDGNDASTVEAFRRLRTSLAFSRDDHSVRILSVVGLEQGIGKTHTAIGLASQNAALGLPVVLVDADLRHPQVHTRLQLPLSPGLGDLPLGADADTVLTPVPDIPDLSVITAGRPLADPGARLSADLSKTLARLGSAELIVIDTPAASLFAEAAAVAAQCDGAIVVIDARRSHRRDVVRLVNELRQLGARPLGVVLNRTQSSPQPYAKTSEPVSAPPEPEAAEPATVSLDASSS